jgi:hypothetical protein
MTTSIAKRDPLGISIPGFTFTPVGVEITGSPEFEDWRRAIQFSNRCESSVEWWIGDLLNFGYATYGDMAKDFDHYCYGTLRNVKWVAAHVPCNLRNDKLTYTHHVAVAPLEPADQKKWLKRAVDENMTVKILRHEIGKSKNRKQAIRRGKLHREEMRERELQQPVED